MTSLENLPYRPCVGIALFNRDGLVFAGERCDNPGAWQMPQGGIDEGEDLERAARRELREEIGTDKADFLALLPEKLRYDLPPEMQKKFWGGRYRGQEQSWVAMRFMGTDSDIDIAADAHREFLNWRWVRLADLPDLIVPFKRETYLKVIAGFSSLSK